jgi:hypothetical protein
MKAATEQQQQQQQQQAHTDPAKQFCVVPQAASLRRGFVAAAVAMFVLFKFFKPSP